MQDEIYFFAMATCHLQLLKSPFKIKKQFKTLLAPLKPLVIISTT